MKILVTEISLAQVGHFVGFTVTLVLGMIFTVHIGFASRAYFAERRKNSL